jgi:hypothetical protein
VDLPIKHGGSFQLVMLARLPGRVITTQNHGTNSWYMSRPFNKKDHPPRHRGQKNPSRAGSWQVSVDAPAQCKEWMNRDNATLWQFGIAMIL